MAHGMKFGDRPPQARLNQVMAVGTKGEGIKSLRSQILEARSSSLGWRLYSKCKGHDLKEKRDML